MTGAMRDFLVKFGASLAVSGVVAFFSTMFGMYVYNAQQQVSISNIQRDIDKHDSRIERLEFRSEAQGKDLAKLSSMPNDIKEIREDVKKLLSRGVSVSGQPNSMQIYSLPRE